MKRTTQLFFVALRISPISLPSIIFGFAAALTAFAQGPLPRFETADCPIERSALPKDAKIECKWLVVPEVRGNSQSRSIKLAVVVLRAKEPDSTPPLVFLHGGPGVSGVRSFTPGVVGGKLDQHRDVVIYDQRGSGFSEPKFCPEFKDVERESQKLKTQKEFEAFVESGVLKCVASLDERIVRSAYNTRASAADMIDLRKLLGYATWDVFSNSYGARLAQEALRSDPKSIRSVVLHKPVPRGPAFHTEAPISNQRAFERVFADCIAQPECRAAFPSLEKDFYDVYDELNKTPISVPVGQNPNDEGVMLDGKRFLDRVRNYVISPGNPERLSRLPLLINEFRRGDKTRGARVLVGYNPFQTAFGGNTVLVKLVNCYDLYHSQSRAEQKANNTKVRAPFRRDLRDECKLWQKQFADPSEWEPIRSDIPTLILTGRYDDRTPTESAKRIASTLTRSYLYEFPDEAHGPQPRGCHAQIIFQFLADPFREPDTSCISKLQPIIFATRWDEVRGPQAPSPTN